VTQIEIYTDKGRDRLRGKERRIHR